MLEVYKGIYVYGEPRSVFVHHILTERGLGCLEIHLSNGVNDMPTILKIEYLLLHKICHFSIIEESMLRSACDKINWR